jgi:hypothetical protein
LGIVMRGGWACRSENATMKQENRAARLFVIIAAALISFISTSHH